MFLIDSSFAYDFKCEHLMFHFWTVINLFAVNLRLLEKPEYRDGESDV